MAVNSKSTVKTEKIKWTKVEKDLIRAIVANDPENKNGDANLKYLKKVLNPKRKMGGIAMKVGRIRKKDFGLKPIYVGDTINL